MANKLIMLYGPSKAGKKELAKHYASTSDYKYVGMPHKDIIKNLKDNGKRYDANTIQTLIVSEYARNLYKNIGNNIITNGSFYNIVNDTIMKYQGYDLTKEQMQKIMNDALYYQNEINNMYDVTIYNLDSKSNDWTNPNYWEREIFEKNADIMSNNEVIKMTSTNLYTQLQVLYAKNLKDKGLENYLKKND